MTSTLVIMTRTYTRTLNLILIAAFAAAFMVATHTHDAPVGNWVGSQGQIDSMPPVEPNVPKWLPRYKSRFRRCSGLQGRGLGDVVVMKLRGDVQQMDFGMAWDRNHNATRDDDVWVVGWCAA